MWNLFDLPEDISPDEYAAEKQAEATVGWKDELGAYIGEGMEWNVSIRVGEWLGRHGDYTISPEDPFGDVEFAEIYDKDRNTKISQEEWRQMIGDRKNLEKVWEPGMNKLDADYLLRKDDERLTREFVFQHREGGWRTFAGSLLMLATQALDPTVHLPILGYGTKVNALGKALGLSRLVKSYPVIGGFVVNAADAALGTAIADSFLIPWMHEEGNDVPWSAMAWDVVYSMGAAGLLTGIGHGLDRLGKSLDNLDTPGRKHQKALTDYVEETFGDKVTTEDLTRAKEEYDAFLKKEAESPTPPERMIQEDKIYDEITEKPNIGDEGVDRKVQADMDARIQADLEDFTARRAAGELDPETARIVEEIENLNSKTEARAKAYEELLNCL